MTLGNSTGLGRDMQCFISETGTQLNCVVN